MIDQIYRAIKPLWETPTESLQIITHLCFLVVSSFAFFFFIQMAILLEATGTIIITDQAVWNVNYLVGISNLLINIFSILIIFEVSDYIAKAYHRYRRENL
jgi:uncharacterized membrane protein